MKIIPFDLNIARAIQNNSIAGTIKTKNGLTCKIVSYLDGGDFFVERTAEIGGILWCYPYTKEGKFIDGEYNGGTDYDLIIEVPETKNTNELSRNFTTPEQSVLLMKLGVPMSSADCYYSNVGHRSIRQGIETDENFFLDHKLKYLPCWSVGRLIEIYHKCCNDRILGSTIKFVNNIPPIDDILHGIDAIYKYCGGFDFNKLNS